MDVQIKGLAQLQQALDELPAKIERNVLRGALRAAAGVIREEAQSRVPVKSGALRDSIRVSVRVQRGRILATVRAGDKRAYYAGMVEFGTARHVIKPKNAKKLFIGGLFRSSVEHPGAKQKPFMRPAFDTKAQEAVLRAAEYIRKRLTKQGIEIPEAE
jgi:HK97 gp10 family phage protein